MTIFSEEKYSATRICEACFKKLDVSYRHCPDCRRPLLCDSVNAVGRAKVGYGVWCFVFAAIPLIVSVMLFWNVGLSIAGALMMGYFFCQ